MSENGMWVFFPLHDIGVFAAGFMTMLFIGLFLFIFRKDGGRDDHIV